MGTLKAKLPALETDPIAAYMLPAVRSWRVFHFHDTSAWPLCGTRSRFATI